MTSSKTPTNRMLLIYGVMIATLVFAPLSAFADKKSDLYAKGVKSMNAGGSQDIMDAKEAFCQVTKEDPEYSDGTNPPAQKLCGDMTTAAARITNLAKTRFSEG